MAGGPLLPSSIYVGGASGNLSVNFYVGTTATGTGAVAGYSALEGVSVVASLAADALAVLQFNMPPIGAVPTGTLKLRLLANANAASGIAKLDIIDGVTSPNTAIGASNFTTEAGSPTLSVNWATAPAGADILVENKVVLSATVSAGQVLTVILAFRTSGWTLAQASVWQASIIWE
jgi:hypothetical protein